MNGGPELVRTGRDTPDELDAVDWERFVLYAYGHFGVWENAYLNYQEGLISDSMWQAWDDYGKSLWLGPGYRRFWEQEKAGHATAFQEYVDRDLFAGEVS